MKQKTFRTILIGCLLISSLLLSGTAHAQDGELPDPGITPDSPLYFFDTLGKNIGMFFTFGTEAKAQKALQYAEERLAEARAMAIKNRIKEMTRAANDYDDFMAMVSQRAEELRRRGVSDNISERVALATSKHLSVLDRIRDEVPGQAEEAITRARTVSMNAQKTALRVLARTKPERAIDINVAAIESRLNRARIKATENITAEMEEALEDAAELSEVEDEISEIAQNQGTDNVTIAQRIAQATANRIEVLAGVDEKVPEQARTAIARAMDNSLRKYDRAMEKLSEKNKPAEISEEAQALLKIREALKESFRLTTASENDASDNTSLQNQNRVEVQERLQENANEWLQSLKLPVPGSVPVASDNKTRENEGTNTENVIRQRSP
jgi:hypothetical protein